MRYSPASSVRRHTKKSVKNRPPDWPEKTEGATGFSSRGALLPLLILACARISCGGGKFAKNQNQKTKINNSHLRKSFHALHVAGFGRVHFHSVARVDEGRHLDDQAGFERRWLHHCAGRSFLQRWLGFHDLELHSVRQVHAD